MVLVDSSIWIRHIRRRLYVYDLIPRGDVAVCPPIVQEVLQGAGDEVRYQAARETLMSGWVLDAEMPLHRFEEAARLYQLCFTRTRRQIRSAMDCLIAACAIAHDVELYCIDIDYTHIAKVAPLRLFTPSPA